MDLLKNNSKISILNTCALDLAGLLLIHGDAQGRAKNEQVIKMAKRITTIEALKKLIASEQGNMFIRWSRGFAMDSKQGVSRDHQSGSVHSGLSAVEVNSDWATDDVWMAKRVTEYFYLKMKDSKIGCHIYTGEIVGTDSDGYESITNITHVATLSRELTIELMQIKGAL